MSGAGGVLRYAERIGVALCERYRGYGYAQYKMSKFEEYDLYARNKEFLVSDTVLTFTDLSGRLMALKPDVTFSIVRNSRDDAAGVQKVCYTENVYRATGGSRSFHEILQAGLECIGDIDDYQLAEVLFLAADSLRLLARPCVLTVSHLDILADALARLGLSDAMGQRVLTCVGEKNLHELSALCQEAGAPPEAVDRLLALLRLSGAPEAVLPALEALECPAAALAQLRRVADCLESLGCGGLLRIDFSLVSDMNYYNGMVWKGFVDGVPEGVLSGGQYDRLMHKMGRRAGAAGFAVYLDALERLGEDGPACDVELLLLYDADADVRAVSAAVQRLVAEGHSVSAQRAVPEKLKYKALARLRGSEVIRLESDA